MPQRPNVLLIAIDSIRADHMSCYGYDRLTTPYIDRFAQGGALFENTFSPHIPTTSAYASMLTGLDCFGTQVVALRIRDPCGRKRQPPPKSSATTATTRLRRLQRQPRVRAASIPISTTPAGAVGSKAEAPKRKTSTRSRCRNWSG